MNIFHIEDKIYITKVDQFSKFLFVHSIHSEMDHQEKLEQIMAKNHPEYIIMDGRTIFTNSFSKNGRSGFARVKKLIDDLTDNSKEEQTLIKLICCLSMDKKARMNEKFQPNDIIVVKTNQRHKPKSYVKHTVKLDQGDSILTTENMVFPKYKIQREF